MHRTAVLACALAMCTGSAFAQEVTASANMIDAQEKEAGTVTFRETKSGFLHVIVEMTGLPPGPHGFHVHEVGRCDLPDFQSAGGHYAGGKEHGVDSENGPHAGDFPNVHVGQDGILKVEFFTDRLSIARDKNPLMDADGSAVLVHAHHDDHATQPSGEAGGRIACGVVTQQ